MDTNLHNGGETSRQIFLLSPNQNVHIWAIRVRRNDRAVVFSQDVTSSLTSEQTMLNFGERDGNTLQVFLEVLLLLLNLLDLLDHVLFGSRDRDHAIFLVEFDVDPLPQLLVRLDEREDV